MLSNTEIRALGRQSLEGRWGRSAGHLLLLYIVLAVPIGIIRYIPIIGWLAVVFVSGAIALGIYGYYLDIARGQDSPFASFFSGFNRIVDAFVLYLVMMIFVFLWSLLLYIPGIIAAMRYSQAYYILRDNPDITPLEAIRRSKAMMQGYKMQYFLLCLSFIGWAILAMLTCGIGMLWLYPYILTSYAHFYENLRARTLTQPTITAQDPSFTS